MNNKIIDFNNPPKICPLLSVVNNNGQMIAIPCIKKGCLAYEEMRKSENDDYVGLCLIFRANISE